MPGKADRFSETSVGERRPVSVGAYDSGAVSDALAIHTGDLTRVLQSFQDEVDINTIVRRFGLTREMPFGSAAGVFGDFTEISDYESALERVRGAQDRFMTLPPEVRERFGNDPALLVRAASELSEAEFVEKLRVEQTAPVGGVPPVVVAEPIV